jgi:hypothetical protein
MGRCFPMWPLQVVQIFTTQEDLLEKYITKLKNEVQAALQ